MFWLFPASQVVLPRFQLAKSFSVSHPTFRCERLASLLGGQSSRPRAQMRRVQNLIAWLPSPTKTQWETKWLLK